jgi:hypothetical protein
LVVVCQPHSWYYSRVSHLPLTIGLTTIFLILPFVCSSHIFHYYDRWVVDANHLWGQLSSRIKNTEGCQPKRSNAIPSRSPHLGIPSCTNPSGRLSVHSVILSSIPVFVSTRAGHRNPYMAYIRPYYGSRHRTVDAMGELIIRPFLYGSCTGRRNPARI